MTRFAAGDSGPMKEKDLRAAIIAQCRALNALGINQGTSGNISARLGEAMLITPSAIPYNDMRPEMLAADAARRRIWRLVGSLQAFNRMALSSRHHARPRGSRRDRPLPPTLRDRSVDAAQADPRRPLHDRHFRRPERALHRPMRPMAPRNCPISRSPALKGATACCSAITA